MTHETQQTVSDWIEESFPNASMRRRLKHLFEEVTELALALDPELELADIQAIVGHTAAKATGGNAGSEIADVRIALSGIATAAGIDEQEALDETMAGNRERSLADRQAREAGKQQLTIFRS